MLDVDDCINNKCDYGVCVDGVSEYTCSCDQGWEGQFCNQGKSLNHIKENIQTALS